MRRPNAYDRLLDLRGHTLRIVIDGDDVVLFHDSARLPETGGGYFLGGKTYVFYVAEYGGKVTYELFVKQSDVLCQCTLMRNGELVFSDEAAG